MKHFTFWWSPEGCPLCVIKAKDQKTATAEFKRQYKNDYAQYMGEVYVTEENHPRMTLRRITV